MSASTARKIPALKEIAALSARGKGSGKEKEKLGDFIHAFYHLIPADDLAGWTAEGLYSVAADVFAWGASRKPGAHKLRVFNPPQKKGDTEILPTIIQSVNDDMPFIIDSLSAELAFRGLRIDTLFHPVFNVVRDGKGGITGVSSKKTPEKGHITESWIFIRLEKALSDADCAALTALLNGILEDVRLATSDWHPMQDRMDKVIGYVHGQAEKKRQPDTDIVEGREFLSYLRANNFTFLGYCEYRFAEGKAQPVKNTSLGVLKRRDDILSGNGAVFRQMPEPVMVNKLIDTPATVHRRVPLDAVAVRITGKNGQVTGMHFFIGLFTSSTYSCRTVEVPIVRKKVRDVIARTGFPRGSHDQKALEHILEKMPRDELFHVTVEDLYTMSLGILRLQEKHTTALFVNRDPLLQYVTCLIYVPRDRFNTKFRMQAAQILEGALGGSVINFFTTLDDSQLARLLLTMRLEEGGARQFDHAAMEKRLTDLAHEWDERLSKILVSSFGRKEGTALADVYSRAFSVAYHETTDIENAIHDIRQLEHMRTEGEDIRVDFYRLQDTAPEDMRLKVYHRHAPVALCDILPLLENMGLRILSEVPYEVRPTGQGGAVWIHDFSVQGAAGINIDDVKDEFEDAFGRVWTGQVESDGLNQLVVRAGLAWHEVRVLRAYSRFMRQARLPYSRPYVEQVLNAWPQITREIVELFKTRHDPQGGPQAVARCEKISAAIDTMLHDVSQADHDRILRSFKTFVEKTLRTNYFQRDKGGAFKPFLSLKLDSKNIESLPLPRPHVEIFVYSSRFEGVHLRGGKVARGGIRWSDRFDDFRTEVLGLVKAQMVKNTVIVPVGAKGGFIVKQPPATGGREAYQAEGIECYKLFVQALLDLTDNNVKGRIVPPKDVVCHDEADPYLVVAADKGTATFSDIANELSCKAGFWLGDAFASGGSTGYDHKEIGITARGGWECVKRHFREMGKDIQKEEFTCVGVGDMGGDVFGNAMLLSKKIKLLAAFNHVHIFCDPDPDLAISYAERARLFKARKGWDGYDTDKLSPGGMVFDRSAKSLKLTPQIRKSLGLDSNQVTPDDLIQAILKAEAELLWFGGIGTFIKSYRQSHADADDRINDALRVDGQDVRAKVIGEGANLGVTQAGRVEYARAGGRINTDFIDNAGGVDCSDHEVNIKILLSDVVAARKLSVAQRNRLMAQMTDDVAALVLRDNYQQAQSLSLQAFSSGEDLAMHGELIRKMERAGVFHRRLEGLPDEESMARLARDSHGLTRPELCILMSWVKMTLYNDILASSVPDDPALKQVLFDYFPKALHKYEKELLGHKLRREIIATQVVNMIVNRMGSLFVYSRVEKTGATAADVVRAFLVAAEAFGLQKVWSEVEALDGKVAATVQVTALHEVFKLSKRAITWLLRFGGIDDIGEDTASFRPGIALLKQSVHGLLPQGGIVATTLQDRVAHLQALGVPEDLAMELGILRLLSSACDIIHLARELKLDLATIASAYFMIGEQMHVDWLRLQLGNIVATNKWQARVMGSLADDYYMYQAGLTSRVMKPVECKTNGGAACLETWRERHAITVARFDQMIAEMKTYPKPEVEMLVLAGQRLGQIAGGVA